MSRFMNHALRITAVVVAMSMQSSPADAQGDRQGRSRPAPRRPVIFEISGVYTGVFNGVVSIDGVGYPISSNAQVYLLGDGMVPLSMVPVGNRIYAAGRGALGSGMIETLIARPINDDRSRPGTEPVIKLRDPNAPL